MTLPKQPKRTEPGSQVLKACPGGCGTRIAQDQKECSACMNMTRNWENNHQSNAHPREPRP